MRTVWISLGYLVVTTTSAPGWANWEYTRWGMSPEEVAAASSGAVKVLPQNERLKIASAGLEYAASGTYRDDTLLLNLRFSFDLETKGLECVAYAVQDPAQNALLKETLIKHFGPPQNENGLSAIGMEELSWTEGDHIDFTSMPDERATVIHCRE